ncbi:MAG: hypothetical protein K0S74_1581 [Chlamydiales bacterium]|nr:hypothetical protein [Chlamydiales bacterium]
MKEKLVEFFFNNQPRKLAAIILSFIVWALVNDSIVTTKTFSKIPIRIVNLHEKKTIVDLLPDGRLAQRVSITISGPKNGMELLEASDLEIVIDASDKEDEWIAEINKKSVVCHNNHIDLQSDSYRVVPNHLIIRLSNLVMEKILVRVNTPIGEAPKGYEYLDVWPQNLTYQVTGAEERIRELKTQGLELTFDLNQISIEELDLLQGNLNAQSEDEISFFVPKNWKRLPLKQEGIHSAEPLSANKLRINFLRKHLLKLDQEVPLHLFFPLNSSTQLNPDNYSLTVGEGISSKKGIYIVSIPLYGAHVSRLFLDIVRDYLEIAVIVDPANELGHQKWSIEFVNPTELEQRYIQRSIHTFGDVELSSTQLKQRQEFLRNRFQSYMREFSLHMKDGRPLNLAVEIKKRAILVKIL